MWEYKVERSSLIQEGVLNRNGKDNWELISITIVDEWEKSAFSSGGMTVKNYIFIYKRKKN